ncbi:hypothetical protein K0U27_04770 [archaeon]|nr:hypothetical protein [archaeon]
MICKGVCNRHKATKPREGGRYVVGQKRCNSCDMFMYWDGIFCPCCRHRLRTGPRNAKNKEIFLKVLHQKRNFTRKNN